MNLNPEPTFAANMSQLAGALGLSRQLIAWHCKKPDSPGRRPDGRYCIEDWRSYFAACGRVQLDSGSLPRQDRDNLLLILALSFIGESLPACVQSALKRVDLPEATKDRVALRLWTALAQVVTNSVPDDGTGGVSIIVSEEILRLARKRRVDLSKVDSLLS